MLSKKFCLGAALCLVAATPAMAVNLQLDPAATYLRISEYTGWVSHNAFAYSLGSLGFAAGDTITLSRFGEYMGTTLAYNGTDTSSSLVAVFSSSNTLISPAANGLLFQTPLVRLPGALATTLPDYVTQNSYHGLLPNDPKQALPTDIPEDFFVSKSGTTVEIPIGAQYIFFTVNDSLIGDNSDPNGNFGVSITAVPEPTGWAMMGLGLALAGIVSRRTKRD